MTRRHPLYRVLRRWPSVCLLWLLWVVLWAGTGPVVLVGGLVVAVLVVFGFPLPAITPRATLRPWLLARLVGRLLVDLVVSSALVAWQAVRHGPRTPAAVIEVPLTADSDLLVTVTALLTTVTPGALVVEIDRARLLLYIHALPVRGPLDADRRRREVQDAERRVIRALGRDPAVRPPRLGGKEERP